MNVSAKAISRRDAGRTAAVLSLVLLLPAPTAMGSRQEATTMLDVIVRATSDGLGQAADAIARAGGSVRHVLPIIDGFSAAVPEAFLEELSRMSGVRGVSPDQSLQSFGLTTCKTCDEAVEDGQDLADEETKDGALDSGSMSSVTQIVGAQAMWKRGFTGKGIDVALIDTGVAPVAGLQESQILYGPDLSFDSQSPSPHLDAYGHGTHMAGIIAGRDDGVSADSTGCTTCLNRSGFSDTTKFVGVAPEARVVSMRVGAFDGAADVSQVIAAIDWVVQHRNDNGMNIRVINLSFGTDSLQSYVLDPLAFAVEVAWQRGIFVVVASGNEGADTENLAMPAADPFVLAVGAQNPNSTLNIRDDFVPEWAQRGTPQRRIDVVAPGVSVASLDVPGSFVNENHETVHTGRFLRGSGTSQAAAVASGAAALMFQKYPTATPDQIKAAILASARVLPLERGYRALNVRRAAKIHDAGVSRPQPFEPSVGTGSLEQSRGTMHVAIDDDPLYGEQDIFGTRWDGQRWSTAAAAGSSWDGGTWNGNVWTGDHWEGQRWSVVLWEANMWNGQRWSGQRWSGQRWSGQRWSGSGWDGQRWSGSEWDGQRWDGQRWSGQRWSGQRWSGHRWSGHRWSGASWS